MDREAFERRLAPSGDPGHSEVDEPGTRPARAWGPVSPFGTEDAARLGLDKNTLEGAQLAFFSHLDGSKLTHKLVALVALLVLVGWPLFLTVERILHS
ncbi:MAG: hypothetical protein JWO46_3369 [Nocardioidaceae bacterium]|nr:hypothetical protein [Nocardioidaceae bacterium]